MDAVIIEVESLSAERLLHLVQKADKAINVMGILSSVESSKEWFRDNSPPDLIFLDIQLGDGTAFDLLSEVDISSSIIFTTAYDEYAIRAFKYNSIDYLLKPIEKNALISAIAKMKHAPLKTNTEKHELQSLRKIISGEYKKRFLIKVGEQFKNLEIDNVAYFSYYEGSCALTTRDNKRWPIDYSLDQVEEVVNPIDFFRVNRQFIVNAKSIEEIHTYFNSRLLLTLNPENNKEVIVSRDRVNDFKRWLDC
ncbi:MAG: LytTR family DNA-binding domain-containing protein [Bacteroidota bacterium]